MNGLDITRRILDRLRAPSDTALPYSTVLETAGEVIAMKRLDLALSEQNSVAETSDWFTPSSGDFLLSDHGLDDVLMPIRLERRSVDSEQNYGANVPLVNYQVLETSINGAASFYGYPMRLVFRDNDEYLSEQQYRLVYETDFTQGQTLAGTIELPTYFKGMIAVECCAILGGLVQDDTPEWASFLKVQMPMWFGEIARWDEKWKEYVRKFKGKAQVPKVTFLQRRLGIPRTRYFKG